MAEGGDEQNKTEEASQYKLERARKKGTVARGADLGFLSTLVAIAVTAQMFGADVATSMALSMRRAFVGGIADATDPQAASSLTQTLGGQMLWPVAAVGVSAAILIVFVDIVQLRGFVFSGEPLKPDFGRLNPAKGLKRVFSLRMLKESAKSVLKMLVYAGAAYLLIRSIIADTGMRAASGALLAPTLVAAAVKLLLLFIGLAAAFAILDQLMVRREFAKQMRMSKRDQTRENREREGEPRQKQKRKQLHAEYIKQNAAVAQVFGADVLVVNPEHYAVALTYDPKVMDAPHIKVRGRNAFALRMRQEARRLGILVIENAPLAQALYKRARVGASIPQAQFAAVADIYIMLHRQRAAQEQG